MQADYTKQLAEIAAALRQPTPWWTNSWILASFSAVLGMLGGLAGQLILQKHTDRQTRKTLLRLSYQYTAELMAALDTLASAPEPFRKNRYEALLIVLPTSPEEYARAHREIYAALDEAASFDLIFNISKKLQQPFDKYDYVNIALQAIVMQFVKERLKLKGLAKCLDKEATATFSEMLARHESTVRGILRQDS